MLELQLIEESVEYTRKNLKPATPKTKKCIGNVPDELHEQLAEFAEKHNIKMYQAVGALWDFVELYEENNEKELKAARAGKR